VSCGAGAGGEVAGHAVAGGAVVGGEVAGWAAAGMWGSGVGLAVGARPSATGVSECSVAHRRARFWRVERRGVVDGRIEPSRIVGCVGARQCRCPRLDTHRASMSGCIIVPGRSLCRTSLEALSLLLCPRPLLFARCSASPYCRGSMAANWGAVMGSNPRLWFWPVVTPDVLGVTRGGTDFWPLYYGHAGTTGHAADVSRGRSGRIAVVTL